MFARESGKRSWEQLEEEELGGMKLQGPSTAVEAFGVIKKRKSVRRFPLLTTIYRYIGSFRISNRGFAAA